MYESLISAGELCFKEETLAVCFELTSNILGIAEHCFDVNVQPKKTLDTYETFKVGYKVKDAFDELVSDEFTIPRLSIKSIDEEGLMVIEFSDPFVPLTELTRLTTRDFNVDGQMRTGLDINVVPNDE